MSNVLHKLDTTEFELTKKPNVNVGDYVCINQDGIAVKAKADSINTMPAVGRVTRVVGNKCYIKRDVIEDVYADIEPRLNYFISDTYAGQLTDEPPTGTDTVIQEVGIGISDDRILISINPSDVIIRS